MLIRADSLETAYTSLAEDPSALAAHVQGYLPPEVCDRARGHVVPLLLENSFQRIYRSQVRAFTEAISRDVHAEEGYLDQATEVLRAMRLAFLPFASPADMFRADLDEVAPHGATLLRFGGRPLVFGMMRSWESDMEALPHFDIIQEATPAFASTFQFSEQFGVNIYTEGPRHGGELLVWDKKLGDLVGAGFTAQDGTYGFDRERLPPPDVVIQPGTGDLVIVRSTRLHAVNKTIAGRRVSVSGFLGVGASRESIKLWS
ncbi:hypothetical protein GCM10009555_030990 [Acrocarpospora macrocephala]|uniref:Uncharacterized protein n=1 Tax=Acrocarpospora macrocephala TaxID=150177 RepID=A0A5M3WUQ8_9ACTN|nr:2OG-Fe(II) oxygenase [Acrocarpospora macrocephala]GES12430.1 hypothetical protein Amac_060270 [Acrocarpospora macrocephala]